MDLFIVCKDDTKEMIRARGIRHRKFVIADKNEYDILARLTRFLPFAKFAPIKRPGCIVANLAFDLHG